MNKAQAAAAAKEQRAAQYALVTKLEKLGHKHGAAKIAKTLNFELFAPMLPSPDLISVDYYHVDRCAGQYIVAGTRIEFDEEDPVFDAVLDVAITEPHEELKAQFTALTKSVRSANLKHDADIVLGEWAAYVAAAQKAIAAYTKKYPPIVGAE